MVSLLRIAETGRINIPAQVRKMVGLEHGGPVSVWVEDGEIRVRPVRDVMVSLQAEAASLFEGSNESVDQFLADRRAEAERDELS